MKPAHTPPNTPPPAQPGGEPSIDLVGGDPPVPITVWRTPGGDDQAAIPTRLAQRLVAAYSRPGETVIDLTDDHALAAAALPGGRHHHKGWFTDASTLIIGPPTAAPTPTPPTHAGADRPAGSAARRLRGADVDPPELAAWFGDDLTEDLPPSTGAPPEGAGTVAGATSLVVACWPLHAVDAKNRKRLRALLRAGAVLLRPGGCLVLVVVPPAAALATPEDFGPLLAAARDAGLGYLQHIVALRTGVDGDQFTYYATDAELLALAASGEAWAVAHLRVHLDLLVLTLRQTAAGKGGVARG